MATFGHLDGSLLAHHVSRVGHGNVASLGRGKDAKVRPSVVPEGRAVLCRLSSVLPSRRDGSTKVVGKYLHLAKKHAPTSTQRSFQKIVGPQVET